MQGVRAAKASITGALALVTAAIAADAAPTVRIICQTEWRDDMLDKPAPKSGRAFDISVPLADIPASATAVQLFLLAEKRAGVHAPHDFLSRVRVFRHEPESPFQLIDHRRLRDPAPFAPQLRSGDIVVYHGIVDYFGAPK